MAECSGGGGGGTRAGNRNTGSSREEGRGEGSRGERKGASIREGIANVGANTSHPSVGRKGIDS